MKNYQIDEKTQTPAYMQLYQLLADDIVKNVYPYGSKLPSKRVIAEETGVSVITVEHAVELLLEEGYVESRERSGVFVIYRNEDFLGARVPAKEPPVGNSVPAHDTDSEAFPFPSLAKTMRKVLLDYGEKIMTKSPNHGCPELRDEICRYLAMSRGIVIEPEQVIIGSGAEYLYGLIAQLFSGEKTVAIENPSYSKIQDVYEAMGLTCDKLTLGANGIVTEELSKTKAKILHVTPFNSFPSGVTADISKKLEYIRWAKSRDGILIEDNYDSELTVSRKVETPLFTMDSEARVIYLNSFSKTLAPSMRIGYMILPTSLIDDFNAKLGFYSCTVPIFDQYVLAEILKNGDFERHINRVRRNRRKKQN